MKWFRDYHQECGAWTAALDHEWRELLLMGDGYEMPVTTWRMDPPVSDGWEDECRRVHGEATKFSGWYGVIRV